MNTESIAEYLTRPKVAALFDGYPPRTVEDLSRKLVGADYGDLQTYTMPGGGLQVVCFSQGGCMIQFTSSELSGGRFVREDSFDGVLDRLEEYLSADGGLKHGH